MAMMAACAPQEDHIPQTKLVALPKAVSSKSMENTVLPAWFRPPPGLESPPGLTMPKEVGYQGLLHSTVGLDIQKFEEGVESDNEGTSVGTGSSFGTSLSDRDENEADESEEMAVKQPKVSSPSLMPRSPPAEAAGTEHRTSLCRTPLRSGASLFVPGQAPQLPFVPMAQVEQAWQRWSNQSQCQKNTGKKSKQKAKRLDGMKKSM